MAKGSPSMIALLGMLAVAGYQNRDKLGAMLNSATDPNRSPGQKPQGQEGGLLDTLREMADNLTGGRSEGGMASGGMLGGLSELVDRFTNAGQETKAKSWISTGRNETIGPDELAQTLDDETIAELVEKTGLSRSELLTRLSLTLPEAVDQVTPDGRFPPVLAPEPRLI